MKEHVHCQRTLGVEACDLGSSLRVTMEKEAGLQQSALPHRLPKGETKQLFGEDRGGEGCASQWENLGR